METDDTTIDTTNDGTMDAGTDDTLSDDNRSRTADSRITDSRMTGGRTNIQGDKIVRFTDENGAIRNKQGFRREIYHTSFENFKRRFREHVGEAAGADIFVDKFKDTFERKNINPALLGIVFMLRNKNSDNPLGYFQSTKGEIEYFDKKKSKDRITLTFADLDRILPGNKEKMLPSVIRYLALAEAVMKQ